MKQLTILFALIITAILVTAQPAPELMHYQYKESNPAFIRIYDNDHDAGDYYFTFDDEKYCRGGYDAVYSLARAFADEPDLPGKQGFGLPTKTDPGERIYVGFYDISENIYYELTGNKTFNYSPLGLFKLYVTDKNPIQLNVIPELVASNITFDYIPVLQDIYRDANVFFDVDSKNITDLTVTVKTGGGTLEKTRRWINPPGKYCNYVYHAADTDSILVIEAAGTGKFTDDEITENGIVILENSDPGNVEPPEPDIELLYENDFVKLTKEPYRSFGNYVFIKNLTDADMPFYFWFEKDGSNIATQGMAPAGEKVRVRVRSTDNYDAIAKGRLTVGNQFVWITYIEL